MSRHPFPAALPMGQLPPTLEPPPGTCRACGCTDHEACDTGYGQPCSWVERDLCSRCHGPRRPTRRQAGELLRIAARHGRVDVAPGPLVGELAIAFNVTPPNGLGQRVRLILSAGGRPVGRGREQADARATTLA